MRKLFARFAKDQSGATAIEYALIAAGIGIVIITGVNTLGNTINGGFLTIGNKINTP